MRIEDLLQPSDGMTEVEYQRLKRRYFWNVPLIQDPEGNVLNPPENPVLFEEFLTEAHRRGELLNQL